MYTVYYETPFTRNTVSFVFTFKSTDATAKKAFFAIAKSTRTQFELPGLSMCLLLGVDLPYGEGIVLIIILRAAKNEKVLLLSLKFKKI